MGKNFINLDLWYEISVHDLKTGRRMRHRKGRCYSFVKGFMQWLNASFKGFSSGLYSVKGNDGTTNGEYFSYNGFHEILSLAASSGVSTYGSQVGTGTTAPTITDFALETKIAHGTSSGQLQYSAETFGAPATVTDTTTFIATRVFTNSSGGTITVKEIGMSAGSQYSGVPFLIARDTVADIAILNGQALTLNYTFKTVA